MQDRIRYTPLRDKVTDPRSAAEHIANGTEAIPRKPFVPGLPGGRIFENGVDGVSLPGRSEKIGR